jgi:hypothetical protein
VSRGVWRPSDQGALGSEPDAELATPEPARRLSFVPAGPWTAGPPRQHPRPDAGAAATGNSDLRAIAEALRRSMVLVSYTCPDRAGDFGKTPAEGTQRG